MKGWRTVIAAVLGAVVYFLAEFGIEPAVSESAQAWIGEIVVLINAALAVYLRTQTDTAIGESE